MNDKVRAPPYSYDTGRPPALQVGGNPTVSFNGRVSPAAQRSKQTKSPP